MLVVQLSILVQALCADRNHYGRTIRGLRVRRSGLSSLGRILTRPTTTSCSGGLGGVKPYLEGVNHCLIGADLIGDNVKYVTDWKEKSSVR